MKHRNLRLKYGTHFMAEEGGGGGGGEITEPLLKDWKASLPEELQNDKSLESFDDIGKLARAFVDTKADVGRSIRIPGPDAAPEAIDTFNEKLKEAVPGLMRMPDIDNTEQVMELYDRLGRPKEPSEYPTPEGLPEGDLGDNLKAQLNELKRVSHEAGLTKAQFEAQAKTIVDNFNNQLAAIEGKTGAEMEKLQLDWGAALDTKFKTALDLAQQTNAPQSLRDGIANRSLDADTMKWLDGMAAALSGKGPQMQFQGQQSSTAMTPAEANAQITEIMDRKEYWDPSSPVQQDLVDKVIKLQKIAQSAA